MRDAKASVHGALEGPEHLVAGGGASQAGIQVAGKGAWLPVDALHVELLAIHVQLAGVHLVQAKLVQELEEEKG